MDELIIPLCPPLEKGDISKGGLAKGDISKGGFKKG
jgi:hypothetical protein